MPCLLPQVPEHTWGEDIKIYLDDYANWTNAQFQQQLADRCDLQLGRLSCPKTQCTGIFGFLHTTITCNRRTFTSILSSCFRLSMQCAAQW